MPKNNSVFFSTSPVGDVTWLSLSSETEMVDKKTLILLLNQFGIHHWIEKLS